MRVEMKIIRVSCDRCGGEETFIHNNRRLPLGWERVGPEYCGSGYCSGHWQDVCPKCLKSAEECD